MSSVAKEVGLVINADKTKLLSKNIEPKPEIKLDETVLEIVDDFQYLGTWVNYTMKDFKHRSAKEWTAFWKLKKIWHSNADIKLKIKFFNALVRSVLPYATETYVINAALKSKINAFQTKCLRIFLNISRDDHVRIEICLQTDKHKTTNAETHKTQLSFLGHSIRRNKDDLIQQYCLYVPAHRRCRRGRQKTSYQ